MALRFWVEGGVIPYMWFGSILIVRDLPGIFPSDSPNKPLLTNNFYNWVLFGIYSYISHYNIILNSMKDIILIHFKNKLN